MEMNNENSESLFSFNVGLVESDPYGFIHSELGNNTPKKGTCLAF